MAAVTNKTAKPLSIPLPRGKTLHLGPRKSGQISAHDLEHPALRKLVDAGAIEIVAEDSGSGGGAGGGAEGAPACGSRSPRLQFVRGRAQRASRRRCPARSRPRRSVFCPLLPTLGRGQTAGQRITTMAAHGSPARVSARSRSRL